MGFAEGRAIGDAPLGIGHRSGFLAPLRRWQQQMGVMGGFGIGVGITDHHQRTVAQRRLEPVQLRHAHQRIGGRHPPEIELTALHRLHLLTSGQTRLSRNRSRLKTPGALNLSAVIGIAHQPITRQQMG